MPIDAQVASIDLARDDALGRPTIARALIAAGYAESVEDAFRRLIGWGAPAYVPREGIGRARAIAAIRAAGGMPVLAHFSEAPRQVPLLRELREVGLAGLEVYYRTFTSDTVALVASVASVAGPRPDGRFGLPRRPHDLRRGPRRACRPDSVGPGLRRALRD